MSALLIIFLIALGLVLLFQLNHMKHKVIAMVIIVLVLFFYVSFTSVVSTNNIEMDSAGDFFSAIRVYFSWLGHSFSNMKTLSGNAVRMNWVKNNSADDDYMVG